MKKVQIESRTLLARLNRRFSKDHMKVFHTKPTQKNRELLGEYYLVDIDGSVVMKKKIDLAKFAAAHGCLKPYEQLAVRVSVGNAGSG